VSAVRVAVVGGGLAGLAAALDCADAGAEVSLFESRRQLGGATFSVRRDGLWVDNGQHVALRCCTQYRAFLRRLGVESLLDLQPRLRIPVLAPGGRRALLARSALPAPLHLAGSLLGYAHLPVADRLRAVRAVQALRALDPGDPGLDRETFGRWLRRHGQSERAVGALWNLIAKPTLNLDADEASLLLATMVFRTGLLDQSDACDLAIPRVSLGQLHGDPAAAALRARSVRVELAGRVRRIEPAPGGLAVESGAGTELYDRVVVAVPHHVAVRILPGRVLDPQVASGLGASPIVNVHLHFDEPVLDEPVAAAVDSPLQWLFDRTQAAGAERGQVLAISLSAASRLIGASQRELVEACRRSLGMLLPAARHARLIGVAVTREPRATFRAVPGTARLRPGPSTAVPGLLLAGAWTDTGWPATMEGAVRSGRAAAAAALALPAPKPAVPVEAVA
jgi:hydroxysqualene dehydroxylase